MNVIHLIGETPKITISTVNFLAKFFPTQERERYQQVLGEQIIYIDSFYETIKELVTQDEPNVLFMQVVRSQDLESKLESRGLNTDFFKQIHELKESKSGNDELNAKRWSKKISKKLKGQDCLRVFVITGLHYLRTNESDFCYRLTNRLSDDDIIYAHLMNNLTEQL